MWIGRAEPLTQEPVKRRLLLRWRYVTVIVLAFGWLTVTPGSSQQCAFNATSCDLSSARNERVRASTNQDGCARTLRVERWFCGSSGNCATGTADRCKCLKQEADGEVLGTPILISLDKKSNYKLTSPADGVLFDIDGNGQVELLSWTEPDSDVAFLALDRDSDGAITSGKELFGNFTFKGVANGFVALRQTAMATNGGVKRGSVSSDDPVFAKLLLWSDSNHNGISEAWELRPASDLLSAVGLGYTPSARHDEFGNRFLFEGWGHLRTEPGRNSPRSAEEDRERSIPIWDVGFRIRR